MAELIYDGSCAFCRRWATWAGARLRAATATPWQDADLTPAERAQAQASVLWRARGSTRDRSAACVRVLWAMRGPWPLAGTLLWIVPKPLRDAAYQYVARRWGPL